jgi:hypothetical protein
MVDALILYVGDELDRISGNGEQRSAIRGQEP